MPTTSITPSSRARSGTSKSIRKSIFYFSAGVTMKKNERDAKKPENEARELEIEDLDQDKVTKVTDEQADALRGGLLRGEGSTSMFSDPSQLG